MARQDAEAGVAPSRMWHEVEHSAGRYFLDLGTIDLRKHLGLHVGISVLHSMVAIKSYAQR